MLSLKSEFQLSNRGFKDLLVLIPGWATDYRIFDALEVDYNYLLVTKLSTVDFVGALFNQLDQLKINRASILGFSLGGFLAAEFASSYPERVSEIILLGVRKHYDRKLLAGIKRQIQVDPQPWFYKFYLNCFSRADRDGLAWFRENLLKEYLEKLNSEELIQGLDYLSSYTLEPQALTKIKDIRIFHGQDDLVAPIEEILEIKASLPQAKFTVLADRGHLFCLGRDFKGKAL